MINVLVGDEYLPQLHPIESAKGELAEYAVAAAAVCHEVFVPVADDKTSVVSFRRQRVPRSQHC